jgi:maltose alpha-D-glucosyltransferase/alpha-amylase
VDEATDQVEKDFVSAAKDAVFLPKECQELQVLLEAYILEKPVYELAYKRNNRPPLGIPLHGLLHIVEAGET